MLNLSAVRLCEPPPLSPCSSVRHAPGDFLSKSEAATQGRRSAFWIQMLIFKVNTPVTESSNFPFGHLQRGSSASSSSEHPMGSIFHKQRDNNVARTSYLTNKPVPALLVMHNCSQEAQPDSCILWDEYDPAADESWLSITSCSLHNPLQLRYSQLLCSALSHWVIWEERLSRDSLLKTCHLRFNFYPSRGQNTPC